MASRIYLTGRVTVESDAALIDERHLAGRQGRRAFAYLVLHRETPVARDQLADIIWSDEPPGELDSALSAILSKLRGALRKAEIRDAGIEPRFGSVCLRLLPETEIDIENAANAVDEAEGHWRRGDMRKAWGNANVAVTVARRSFLPQDEAPWIETQREGLRSVLSRGLSLLAAISVENGERELALLYAAEVVRLEPFRETAYQQLMRMHASMGNRGEALRVFGRLREVLRQELGVSPSPQTEAVYLEILSA